MSAILAQSAREQLQRPHRARKYLFVRENLPPPKDLVGLPAEAATRQV
jgi:hypothetical protein